MEKGGQQSPGYPGPPAQYNPPNATQKAYPTQSYQPAPQGNINRQMPQATFDAGARFKDMSKATIPPPPPGVLPNHAQQAAARGESVVLRQNQSHWLE